MLAPFAFTSVNRSCEPQPPAWQQFRSFNRSLGFGASLKEEEPMDNCIFCKIARREIPAKIVGESEFALAFWDVSPRQPLHILVIPKVHYANVAELTLNDESSLVAVMKLASELAVQHADESFRISFNTGEAAGQTVFHAHGHLTSRTPRGELV
jgi:histidine triad (HIT) family protein